MNQENAVLHIDRAYSDPNSTAQVARGSKVGGLFGTFERGSGMKFYDWMRDDVIDLAAKVWPETTNTVRAFYPAPCGQNDPG